MECSAMSTNHETLNFKPGGQTYFVMVLVLDMDMQKNPINQSKDFFFKCGFFFKL